MTEAPKRWADVQAVVSPESLHDIFEYCDDGSLLWKERPASMFVGSASRSKEKTANNWNSRLAGKKAGSKSSHGYITVRIHNQNSSAHKIVWAMHYGDWPDGEIDHINGDKSDNRMDNLRLVDRQINSMNMKLPINSSSGVIGVSWHNGKGRWRAHIKMNGKSKHLGYFADKEEAIKVRKGAEKELGFHENHGRSDFTAAMEGLE